MSYNNTGSDVDSTITGLGGVISAPVNVVDGVTSVTVTGLEATVVDFVTISGNFGLEKTAGGDLEVVGNSVGRPAATGRRPGGRGRDGCQAGRAGEGR